MTTPLPRPRAGAFRSAKWSDGRLPTLRRPPEELRQLLHRLPSAERPLRSGFLIPPLRRLPGLWVAPSPVCLPACLLVRQLAGWNDDPDRTAADVICALEQAAREVAA